MADVRIEDLKPGDIIRYRGALQMVESIEPGVLGYYVGMESTSDCFRPGTMLLVVNESDAVAEAKRIIDEARA